MSTMCQTSATTPLHAPIDYSREWSHYFTKSTFLQTKATLTVTVNAWKDVGLSEKKQMLKTNDKNKV